MSALGQKQTCAAHKVMSALPPKADMCSAKADVRFTPNSGHHERHGSTKTPEHFRPKAFRPRTKLIRRFASASSASEQPQRAEAGGEERDGGRERSGTRRYSCGKSRAAETSK